MRAARPREVAASKPRYERRRPEHTPLHRLVRAHYATFAAEVEQANGTSLPLFVKDEFDAYLECGILAKGFLRLTCGACARDTLVAFSCPPRGLPSGRNAGASARRAAQDAWPRQRRIWWTTYCRQCRCANGCCRSPCR